MPDESGHPDGQDISGSRPEAIARCVVAGRTVPAAGAARLREGRSYDGDGRDNDQGPGYDQGTAQEPGYGKQPGFTVQPARLTVSSPASASNPVYGQQYFPSSSGRSAIRLRRAAGYGRAARLRSGQVRAGTGPTAGYAQRPLRGPRRAQQRAGREGSGPLSAPSAKGTPPNPKQG